MAKSLYDYCLEREEFLLLAQWDKEKNGNLTAREVSRGSHMKIWWRCERGHQWQAPVYTRTGAGSGCPYCTGRKLAPGEGSLATKFPELAKEWHPAKNVDLSPEEVPPATHRKVWWRCCKGHEWQARINSRTRGAGCPICTNRKVKLGENDLATTHPDLAAQWHPIKNGELTPQNIVAGNRRKVWWQCPKGHEWCATVLSRSRGGNGCPVCDGKQVVPGDNDLASAFPEIAAQWHTTKNGLLTPEQVTIFSNRKVWWTCEKGHEYPAVIAQRTQSATGCPYCAGRQVLPGFNDLETLEPLIAAQWHPELNGSLTPRMVTTGSHKKVWWLCPDGHVWKAVVYSRASAQKSGCPVCAGKVRPNRQERYTAAIAETEVEHGKSRI